MVGYKWWSPKVGDLVSKNKNRFRISKPVRKKNVP
jgi:hypothetical protein